FPILYLSSVSLSFVLYLLLCFFSFFFYNAPAPSDISPLSLHDALPISSCTSSWPRSRRAGRSCRSVPSLRASPSPPVPAQTRSRSEEHTSELQSRFDLVCRLLLEKKKKKKKKNYKDKEIQQ